MSEIIIKGLDGKSEEYKRMTEADANIVQEPREHLKQNSRFKGDQLGKLGDTRERLWYWKKVIELNGRINAYYMEDLPGKEPKGQGWQRCSRYEALEAEYDRIHGFGEFRKMYEQYRDKKRAEKITELDIIRQNAESIEKQLLKN